MFKKRKNDVLKHEKKKMHLLILTNIPTPNQIDLFSEIAKYFQLKVLYCAGKESNRNWKVNFGNGYNYSVLPGITLFKNLHFNPTIIWHLLNKKYDCYILGGSYIIPTFVIASLTLSLFKKTWLYWGESLHFEKKSKIKRSLKKIFRWPITKLSAGILAIGSMAAKTYSEAGIDKKHIYIFPYVEGIKKFQISLAKKYQRRKDIDNKFKTQDKILFLYTGQLIARKGVKYLLRAFTMLKYEYNNVALLILGNGERETKLKKYVQEQSISDIHFLGFIQPTQIPYYFTSADVLVFPSLDDGWGLVINEAMSAGLPIISTTKVGAAIDLVQQGGNGFLVETNNSEALYQAMKFFVKYPEKIISFGGKSKFIIENWTPEKSAKKLLLIILGMLKKT